MQRLEKSAGVTATDQNLTAPSCQAFTDCTVVDLVSPLIVLHVRCLAGHPCHAPFVLQNATGREVAEVTHPTCESRKHCRQKAGTPARATADAVSRRELFINAAQVMGIAPPLGFYCRTASSNSTSTSSCSGMKAATGRAKALLEQTVAKALRLNIDCWTWSEALSTRLRKNDLPPKAGKGCCDKSESVTDLRKHSGLMPNIGSVKSSEAHPQSAVALHGKQLLDSLRHECPLRSTGTAGTAACHKGFLEGRGLQPHAHPQLFGKIHGQAMPSSESQTADQYVNQKDDMHGNADGDLIYALGSSEVAALGRWTTLDYFEPNAVHLHGRMLLWGCRAAEHCWSCLDYLEDYEANSVGVSAAGASALQSQMIFAQANAGDLSQTELRRLMTIGIQQTRHCAKSIDSPLSRAAEASASVWAAFESRHPRRNFWWRQHEKELTARRTTVLTQRCVLTADVPIHQVWPRVD
ncbi:unnamed protein product [Symbiodinium microadriaticum]|nr:unnamed protein product [Symbiodinium microadriaticum]